VGTGGDPAEDTDFPLHACARGFAVLAPMYENGLDARSACGDEDGCYDAYHASIVVGGEPPAGRPRVAAADTVLGRLRALAAWLREGDPAFAGWSQLAAALAEGDWSRTAWAGHSQGSGHAAWFARDHAVERVVVLGGIGDRLASGRAGQAPVGWIRGFAARSRTPADRLFVYLHQDDALVVVAQARDNWDRLGVAAGDCSFLPAGGYAPACRRILIDRGRCRPLRAHGAVTASSFDLACRRGEPELQNGPTWDFLLGGAGPG
jgi:hypothetical protein